MNLKAVFPLAKFCKIMPVIKAKLPSLLALATESSSTQIYRIISIFAKRRRVDEGKVRPSSALFVADYLPLEV
jgi:hypothetical protein